jgi:ankyrin repeat protein
MAKNEEEEQRIKEGRMNAIRQLLERGANVNLVNKDGVTALHYACKKGNADVVRMLVENPIPRTTDQDNRAKVDAVDNNGCSSLHYACKEGHLEVVQYLLTNGVTIDAMDNQQKQAVHYAIEENKGIDIIFTLLYHSVPFLLKDT